MKVLFERQNENSLVILPNLDDEKKQIYVKNETVFYISIIKKYILCETILRY